MPAEARLDPFCQTGRLRSIPPVLYELNASERSLMRGKVIIGAVFALGLYVAPSVHAGGYVGSKACGECHEEEFQRFTAHSKKARSWESVEVMASDLTQEELRGCFDCHTTGYGKGGFISHDATPHLADVGCETCHGPGAEHADMGDPSLITRTPTLDDCRRCHNADRVQNFDFKPLIHSGAH